MLSTFKARAPPDVLVVSIVFLEDFELLRALRPLNDSGTIVFVFDQGYHLVSLKHGSLVVFRNKFVVSSLGNNKLALVIRRVKNHDGI